MFVVLYVFFLSFLLVVFWLFWKQHKAIKLLKSCNLTVHPMSLWTLIIESFPGKNQNFDQRVRIFQRFILTSRLYNQERIYSVVIGGICFVMIYKPEHLESVMNSNKFSNKSWMYESLEPSFGKGLITSSGEIWRRKRKMINPAFGFKILESYQELINKHSNVLIRKLKKMEDPWVDVIRIMSLCTLDIISETAMEVEIKAQENENSNYVKAIDKSAKLVIHRVLTPWLWPDIFFYLSPTGREFKKELNIINGFIEKVIQQKKTEMQQNSDHDKNDDDNEKLYTQRQKKTSFLALLLQNGDITEDELRDEVSTFMAAGYETIATAISWALYNVGLHPEIQEKLYDEVQSIFGEDRERSVNSNDLRQMKYLECVLKESLRLYPAVPIIVRSASEDFKLDDRKTIPKGTSVVINIYSIHREPELYANPELFDPDRFLPENSIGRHPYAFIPFSTGPRNCIGQKFAFMEEKILFTNILRHFSVKSLDPRDKVTEIGEIVLRPQNTLRVQFILRDS